MMFTANLTRTRHRAAVSCAGAALGCSALAALAFASPAPAAVPPPAPSPTDVVAYEKNTAATATTPASRQVWTMSSDGRNKVRVAGGAAGVKDFSPDSSPDGSKIVFVSDRDGSDDLYVVNLVTGAVRQLTNTNSSEADPSFSPDGRQIVFSRPAAQLHPHPRHARRRRKPE